MKYNMSALKLSCEILATKVKTEIRLFISELYHCCAVVCVLETNSLDQLHLFPKLSVIFQ